MSSDKIEEQRKQMLIDNVYNKAIDDVLKLIEEDKVLLKIHKFHLKNKIKELKNDRKNI